jgi:hypothetical protein
MNRVEAIYKSGIEKLDKYHETEFHIPPCPRNLKKRINGHAGRPLTHRSDLEKNGSDHVYTPFYDLTEYRGSDTNQSWTTTFGYVN